MNSLDSARKAPLILIADDDELMRSLMTGALMDKGFDTIEVCNGEEAVAALRECRPDLVILDIDMPVMDGFTSCGQIRSLDEGRELPVVIVTGNENVESIDRAYEVGATDFISKPVNWSLLGHRMRYILRSAALRRVLAEREAENRAMLEAIPDRVLLLAPSGNVITLIKDPREADQDLAQAPPRSIAEMLPETAASSAQQAIKDVLADGREVSFEYTQQPMQQDMPERFYEVRMVPQSDDIVLAILRDVTLRKRSEARIQELAYYDSLTGLPNRHRFMQLAGEFIRCANSEVDQFTLCTLNLDRFKRINDTLGHEAGDEILVSVAERLAQLKQQLLDSGVRAEAARLGADQFALIAGWSSSGHASELAVELMSELEQPLECCGHELVVSASIGSARFPVDGINIATLLKNADRALATAKRKGRNLYCRYSVLEERSTGDLLLLESDLRNALECDELELVFQPKFHLKSGRITGAEALLRWHHPRRGLISPGEFIPLAEESGLISQIDHWVIDRTCYSLREWQIAGMDIVPVSINLSGREFCFAQPEEIIKASIRRYEIDPGLLEVEITETVMMEDPVAAADTLNRLKSMGIRLAMDDFGTGYSSLGYLKNFPLDVLKIDRVFIKDLHHDTRNMALCRAIISMAVSLDMECVAEGIETENQRQFLLREGCDIAQGFALARPMAEKPFLELLASNRGSSPRLQLLSTYQSFSR